jgi:lipopolysaccharide heptosyltransferase III
MQEPSKILIFRRGQKIGDTIVALPCFHKIAASFPQARRILLTTRADASKIGPIELLLNGTGLIHDVIAYEAFLRNPLQLTELRRRLIAENIRFAFYLPENRTYAQLLGDIAFLRFCGIKLLNSPLQKDVMHNRVDPHTGHYERESERLARSLASLGPLDLTDKGVWDLCLTTREKSCAYDFLSRLDGAPFIAMSVGGALQLQRWDDNNWITVLKELRTILPGFALVFTGSADDARVSGELGKVWTGPVLNDCGMFSLRESAAILERAYMFLGHDSGPMHLAASRGVHCVAVFGSHNAPGHWYPYGDGHEIVRNMRGIQKISPQDVIHALRRYIASHPVPGISRQSSEIENDSLNGARVS